MPVYIKAGAVGAHRASGHACAQGASCPLKAPSAMGGCGAVYDSLLL